MSLSRLWPTNDVEDSAFLLEESVAEGAKKDSKHIQSICSFNLIKEMARTEGLNSSEISPRIEMLRDTLPIAFGAFFGLFNHFYANCFDACHDPASSIASGTLNPVFLGTWFLVENLVR